MCCHQGPDLGEERMGLIKSFLSLSFLHSYFDLEEVLRYHIKPSYHKEV